MHLFLISVSLHYPRIPKRGQRPSSTLPKRLLQIPGCVPKVRMRVTPEFFKYAHITQDWHLPVALRLKEHIELTRGHAVAESWYLNLSKDRKDSQKLQTPPRIP